MPLDKDVNLDRLSRYFTRVCRCGSSSISKGSCNESTRRVLPDINLSSQSIPLETLRKIIVKMSDFMDVIKEMEPSAMREVFVEVPDIKWDDIGGLSPIKQECKKQ